VQSLLAKAEGLDGIAEFRFWVENHRALKAI